MYATETDGINITQGSWGLLRVDECTSQRLPGGGVSERFDLSFFFRFSCIASPGVVPYLSSVSHGRPVSLYYWAWR